MKKLKINEEFKKIIPVLKESEYDELEKSIVEEGCRDAITTWKGVVVDGHNRYAICKKHKIKFDMVEKDFKDKDEAKVWIIKNQFGRRNLTSYERSELALELEELLKSPMGRPSKSTQKSEDFSPEGETAVKIAKIAGVSTDTIYRTKVIKEKADESTKEKLRTGELSVGKAYNSIKQKAAMQNQQTLTQGRDWKEAELVMKEKIDDGEAVVCNSTTYHLKLVDWAVSEGKYIDIDNSEWRSPFEDVNDGNRDVRNESYEIYLGRKYSLHHKIGDLKGKVLGSAYYPKKCHVEILIEEIEKACAICGHYRKQCECECPGCGYYSRNCKCAEKSKVKKLKIE